MKYHIIKNKSFTPTTKYKNLVCGFSLVEMMVAIAIFSIVMVTAMSALLNVVDANNKARALKSAINNISLALEGISKDMRMGTEYKCSGDGGASFVNNCPNDGGNAISYKSPQRKNRFVYYKFITTEFNGQNLGQIQICLSDESDVTGYSCNGSYTAITSVGVNLTNVKFYVLGVGDLTKQPRMIMTLTGEAGAKEKVKTFFDLQTSVSQRIRIKMP